MTHVPVFSTAHPLGEVPGDAFSDVSLMTPEGSLAVRWEPEAATSTLGLVGFFIEFLHTTGLWKSLIERCPVKRSSPNAPDNTTAIGSVLLTVLSGGNRYRHSEALRGDRITPEMLGMNRMLSVDAIRRFVASASEEPAGQSWLADLLQETLEPAMVQGPWIMDLDSTVVTVYGKQEGTAVGYNPTKRGRPSYSYHTFMMGQLRLPIDVEALPGNESHGSHAAHALWHLLDHRLPPAAHPWCIRGDISYGNETYLTGCEQRRKDFLFKLKQTKKIKALCDDVSVLPTDWEPAGHGWQGRESVAKLDGWSQERRIIILRKPTNRPTPQNDLPTQQTILVAELCPDDDGYEYAVLITSLKHSVPTIAQFYRDRADCENNFADLKNDWSWGGFTTQHRGRNQFMARFTALVYTWWNIFVRQFSPEAHREGHVSRPVLLYGVARRTEHAGRKTLHITSLHAKASAIMHACNAVSRRIKELAKQTATQLVNPNEKKPWHHIIAVIFQTIAQKKYGPQLHLLPQ